MTAPRALITGITGQDGSYLAEFLLERGYAVYGMVRRSSTENFERIEPFRERLHLVQADLLDPMSLITMLSEVRPQEVYNLAAQSFVPTSWAQPVLTAEFDAIGVTRLLEAIRLVDRGIRFYQASSSEMFGKVREVPQTELTPFYPRSPYGVAKVYAHYITVNYRESYGIFACSGILFNHECLSARTPLIVRDESGVKVARQQQTWSLCGPKRRSHPDLQSDWPRCVGGDWLDALSVRLPRRASGKGILIMRCCPSRQERGLPRSPPITACSTVPGMNVVPVTRRRRRVGSMRADAAETLLDVYHPGDGRVPRSTWRPMAMSVVTTRVYSSRTTIRHFAFALQNSGHASLWEGEGIGLAVRFQSRSPVGQLYLSALRNSANG